MATAEVLALVIALSREPSDGELVRFGLISIATQWIALASLGMLYLSRNLIEHWSPIRQAALALGLLLLNTWLVLALGKPTIDALPAPSHGWNSVLARALAIVLAVGLLGLAAFRNYLHVRQLAVRAKQAELEALQARIRPHFLFNTLNTATALVHQRPEEAERLLLDLSDLFRAALAGPREIPLEEELSLARRYLEIESLRFGERLRVEWQLPREIPNVTVPALSIQPLVENAIRHGVERVAHGGRVEIALTTTAEHVVVRISNPLVLSDLERPVSHRVGLNASQARIEALTGGRGSVQTGRQGEHYVATVRLPRTPASGDRRRRL